jgi:serine protease Do
MASMNLKPLVLALAAAGLVASGAADAWSLPSWLQRDKPAAVAQTTPAEETRAATAPPAPVAPVPAQGVVPDYRSIFRQASPAVVGITVEGLHKTAGDDRAAAPGIDPNDPFFQFFRGMPGFGPGPRGRAPNVPFRGQGSGFIISADGLILTNAHVVRDAKEVTVKLADRREFGAKVLGSDPATDIAVLRIDAKNLTPVRLGDPKRVEVGDPVMAIGAPYGLEMTATTGIVSAKGRSLPGEAVVPFIQTDAAVNPGNSGGPLFDAGGAVVGINAQIYSQSGGFQGLSFAIPIDVALKVKDQIVRHGKATHARLGVTIQDLNQGLAESFGLARPDGALVSSVAPGSAAATVGLKAGDVVTEVNGEPIGRSQQLSSTIGLSAPGDRVKLKVWRDRQARDVEVRLGAADTRTTAADERAGDDMQTGQLGLALRPLTPQERQRARVDGGLVVEDAGGPAARAGVAPGDVLLAVNGQPVQSVEQVKSVLKDKPRNVALLVQRGGEKVFVPIRLG